MIHAFAYRDAFLVLDVESGAIHKVDEPTYEIIRAMELGNDIHALPYSNSLINDVLDEIDELRKAGQFDSLTPSAPKRTAEFSPIKSMCLNIAHDCNLRCAYCFAETGEFHGGRMLMPLETAKAALDFLIAHSMGRHNLEVDLFGGEPLMNFDVVKSVVAYGRELEKKHDKCIHFTITTNGVALDDEIIEFINKEMFNLVISIDGRKQVHDALRVTPNGKGSYDIIVPKAQELIRLRGDGEHYVRGTFTAKNLDFTEDVRALTDLGFEQISIEPVVLPADDPCAITEENIDRALTEYDRLSDFVLERRSEGNPFNFFHFMIDLDDSPCLSKRSLGCGAGVEYVAVAPNGDIYPCHQFVGNKDFLLGNVHNDELDNEIRNRFAGCNIFTKEKCSKCWAKYYCSGGCAANANNLNGSIMNPPEISCKLLKKRTELAIGMELLGDCSN
ncbi:MAG: thioether cross-link-forming SCIFF peptide maturase [Christensenellaceae bacterium]|nr:thioether cross-link-forming SCIFF peptide maturase [Christensenellaceae bacterium]